jgi:hypothetical protein
MASSVIANVNTCNKFLRAALVLLALCAPGVKKTTNALKPMRGCK